MDGLDFLNGYGGWAIAFGLLLNAFKDVIKELISKAFGTPSKASSDQAAIKMLADEVVRALSSVPDSNSMQALAHSLERLTDVLERFERDQEKATDQMLSILAKVNETIQKVDFKLDAVSVQVNQLVKRP